MFTRCSRLSRFGFVALLFFAPLHYAHACDCAAPPNVVKAFELADQVFCGEALSIEPAFPQRRKVLFRVIESWKGAPGERFVVDQRSIDSCAFKFEPGNRYLVYVQRGQTHLCGRTAQLRRPMVSEVIKLQSLVNKRADFQQFARCLQN